MLERQILNNKDTILLSGESDGTAPKRVFTILKVVEKGVGASCVCYEAYHENSGIGLLKEFYPIDSYCLKRGTDRQLVPSKEFQYDYECFRKKELEYCEPYRMLLDATKNPENADLKTFLPTFEIYHGCDEGGSLIGTTYIWQPAPTLETFDKICDDIHKDPGVDPEKKLDIVLRSIESLTKSICALHKVGLVHRDIKPSNFGFMHRGDETLLETLSLFDINSFCSVYGRNEGVLGTEGFIEPEAGLEYPTNQTDIFAIGATLFNALIITDEVAQGGYLYRQEYYNRLDQLVEDSELLKASLANSAPSKSIIVRILKNCLSYRRRRYPNAEALLGDIKIAILLNNHQYKSAKPQEYNYHLLWQASCDFLTERLINTLEGRIANINDLKSPKGKPGWWSLEPVKGYDEEGNCYPDAASIAEALKTDYVYMYAPGGGGKTLKACQIMLRSLWELPVLYIDLGLLNDEEISANEILNQVLQRYLDYSDLPAQFIERLKNSDDRFLIVIDNINNIRYEDKKDVFRAITNMQTEFKGAEILLIGRNETIGDDSLDAIFKKIRLEMLDGEENELLSIPFFYMRYQEMKEKDPGFILNTRSEVIFLGMYMDTLWTDYTKNLDVIDYFEKDRVDKDRLEKLLTGIVMIMAKSWDPSRYISEGMLLCILEKSFSDSKSNEIINTLTGKLGLLVPVKTVTQYFDGWFFEFEFAHDIYQDYYTAKWLASLIEESIRMESLKPLSDDINDINIWSSNIVNVVKMLLELIDQQQLDKLYRMLSDIDDHNTEYNGIIRLFVKYYWVLKDHTVNMWAELGVRHKDDFSMAVATTDLITKITSKDRSVLDKAVYLCRHAIGFGYTWDGFTIGNDWAKEYLGMLIMHDALEKAHVACYLDMEDFTCMITSDETELYDPQKYFRIEGPIGKIGDLTIIDGWKLLYRKNLPKEVITILHDLTSETDGLKKDKPTASKNTDAIRVRMKFWNIIKDVKTDRPVIRLHGEDGDIELEFLTFVEYEGNDYWIAMTMNNQEGNGIEEIFILKEDGYEVIDGEVLDRMETVDDKSIKNAIFNIFMNEKDGNEVYETVNDPASGIYGFG